MENELIKRKYHFLQDGGEMGELIRQFDWRSTDLGEPDTWPLSLQMAVRSMLDSPLAVHICWGNEYIQLYNNAFIPILGSIRHPSVLGQRIKNTSQTWDVSEPMFIRVMNGETISLKDQKVNLNKNGFVEECYFDLAYVPVYLEDGNVGGVQAIAIETTDKVRIFQHLLTSQQEFRLMIQQAPVAILVLRGEEIRFDIVNDAMLTLMERDASIIGKPVLEVMPELQNQPIWEILKNVYRTGESYLASELPVVFKRNGVVETGYYTFTYTPLKEGDKTTGILQVAVEMTAQVKARKAIEENENKFRYLIEEAPVATCLFTGSEMRVEIANTIMLGYWGKDSCVVGKPLLEAVPELEGQPFSGILDQVFKTGKIYHEKAAPAQLNVNGELSTFYFDFTFKPLKNESGEVYGIIDMATDVTNQVVTANALAESKEQLMFAIESTELATFDLNPITYKLTGNGRLKEWFGLKPSQDIELDYALSLIAESDRQRVTDAIQESFQFSSGGNYDIEYSIILPDTKSERIIRAKGRSWFNESKVAYRFNGTLQDITKEAIYKKYLEESEFRFRKLSEELESKNFRLERTNNDLDNFIYTASHDLKAPISNIEGLLNAFADDGVFNDDQKNLIDMMFHSIGRFKNTITDLSEVTKSERKDEDHETVSFGEILQEVKLDIRELIESYKPLIEDDFKVASLNYPRKNLRSIIYNLLSNSIKYSSPDRKPEIIITTESENDFVVLKISDNGLGLSKENQGKIFGMFKRAHLHVDGSGIGLYIIKKIIENSGGKIDVESEVGKGTTFRIFLKP